MTPYEQGNVAGRAYKKEHERDYSIAGQALADELFPKTDESTQEQRRANSDVWFGFVDAFKPNEKEVAETLSRFVNGMGHGSYQLAESMASDHRTLQQRKMVLFLNYMGIMARNYELGWFDARNEVTCKLSKTLIDTLVATHYVQKKDLGDGNYRYEAHLPFI